MRIRIEGISTLAAVPVAVVVALGCSGRTIIEHSHGSGTDAGVHGGESGEAGDASGVGGSSATGAGGVANGGRNAAGGEPVTGGRANASGGRPGSGAAGSGATGAGGKRAGAGGGTGGFGAGGHGTGASGTGGYGMGGSNSGGAGGDPYVCSHRPALDPGGSGIANAACCGGAGKCVVPSTLGAEVPSALGHEVCAHDLLCAPVSRTPPPTCATRFGTTSPAGLEGRCLPGCFLLGSPFASLFEECPSGGSCVPCYDPVDGKPTGACSFAGDAPTKPPPLPYARCSSDTDAGQIAGGGACVPQSVLGKLEDPMNRLYDPLLTSLRQDTCAPGEACVPASKAADPASCAEPCTTPTQLAELGFARGACVPEYVVLDTDGAVGLQLLHGPGGTACPSGMLCYPCGNPLTGGTPSGACY